MTRDRMWQSMLGVVGVAFLILVAAQTSFWMRKQPEDYTAAAATPTPASTLSDTGPQYTVWTDYAPVYSDAMSGVLLGYAECSSTIRPELFRNGRAMVRLDGGGEGWVDEWHILAVDAARAQSDASVLMATMRQTPGLRDAPDVPNPSNTKQTDPPTYRVTTQGLNCRLNPDAAGEVVYQLKIGERVRVHGQVGTFYLVELSNSKLCFCAIDWLVEDIPYAQYPGAVDLREYLPGLEFDILFASANNITGHAMYAPVPVLETETAEMLKAAYEQFRQDGYTIKICDAYRPLSAQQELYAAVRDTNYIADPGRGGSWHQRGRAVDITLVDLATGQELEMPSAMHTFSVEASRSRREAWSDTVKANVDYMTKVMQEAGFQIIGTEWWHYENTAQGNYLDKQIDLASLIDTSNQSVAVG